MRSFQCLCLNVFPWLLYSWGHLANVFFLHRVHVTKLPESIKIQFGQSWLCCIEQRNRKSLCSQRIRHYEDVLCFGKTLCAEMDMGDCCHQEQILSSLKCQELAEHLKATLAHVISKRLLVIEDPRVLSYPGHPQFCGEFPHTGCEELGKYGNGGLGVLVSKVMLLCIGSKIYLHHFWGDFSLIGLTLRPHVNLDNDCSSVDREIGPMPWGANRAVAKLLLL